jgi:hypothetical protein
MKFLLQSINNQLSVDTCIVKEILDNTCVLHEYKIIDIEDIYQYDTSYIPIGTIEFIESYLRKFGISHMKPLEIPRYLRIKDILKRAYKIVPISEIPTCGNFFIKDASRLKQFSYSGEISNIFNIIKLDENHEYVISDNVDILSEYRIYVINNKIVNIANYNGDIMILPDLNLLNRIVQINQISNADLKSYSFDVMITSAGTSLIEMHLYAALGLYSTMFNDQLLYAYRDSFNYILKKEG